MDEQQVREAIDGIIVFIEQRMSTEQDQHKIARFGRAIDALIALEHNLGLCGCPPEVYEKAGQA